jgi:hypothetical protein
MEELPCKEIVQILIQDCNVVFERQRFYEELNLPPNSSKYKQINDLYTMDVMSGREFFSEILNQWVKHNKSNKKLPLLSDLLDVLEKCEFINAMGKETWQFYKKLFKNCTFICRHYSANFSKLCQHSTNLRPGPIQNIGQCSTKT